jgi:CheY-like chemotaxis protein
VLVNLAVNARDAMPSGGLLTIETANVVAGGDQARALGLLPGAYVRLGVSDTGHGMDAKTRAQVFEPFFTTKEQGKGTGLGLSTAYGIIAQSGGAICVDSTPGRGTVFWVYLPAAEGEIPDAEGARPDRDGRKAVAGTILLVEDEKIVRELTHELLELAGLEVVAAGDPVDALALCADYPGQIDVLLTDVVMPVLSGPELAERVRELRPGIEVVYMSGYSDDLLVERGGEELHSGFLQKPFTGAALMGAIRDALARDVSLTAS